MLNYLSFNLSKSIPLTLPNNDLVGMDRGLVPVPVDGKQLEIRMMQLEGLVLPLYRIAQEMARSIAGGVCDKRL